MTRLGSFLAFIALGLLGAVLLLLASHQGEANRCHRLAPTSDAFALYGCGR